MLEYHFSISDYSSSAVKGMFFWLITGCLIIGFSVVKGIISSHRHNRAEFQIMSPGRKALYLLRSFAPLAGMLAFFFATTWPTAKYSIYLPSESVEDAIYTSGEIERISSVTGSPKYHIGDDKTAHLASMVTIDGEEFYFLTAEGLKEGMTVEINYLPRSRMVLDCFTDIPIEPEVEEPTLPIETTAQEEQDEGTPLINYIAAIVTSLFIVMMLNYLFILKRRIKKRRQ